MQTFCLKKPVDTAALARLRDEVGAAVAAGETEIAIDIDNLGILESFVISALLGLLQQARASGARIILRASQPRLLDSLRITALDKVFAVAPSEGGCTPVIAKRLASRPMGKFVAAFVAGLFALGSLLGTRASAASDLAPLDLVHNVVAQNMAMSSYRAHVDVKLRLQSFPYIGQHLVGTTYFKRPDNFEVVFDRVPSYAKGFEKLYSDIDDPSAWEKRFDMTFAGERIVAGHRDYVIRLVQKVRGMIDHEDVEIDPASWHIDSMAWSYYNGGEIEMHQDFQRIGEFSVLARQRATIRIPFVHAIADATYGDYATNVAIDDSVFTHEPHK